MSYSKISEDFKSKPYIPTTHFNYNSPTPLECDNIILNNILNSKCTTKQQSMSNSVSHMCKNFQQNLITQTQEEQPVEKNQKIFLIMLQNQRLRNCLQKINRVQSKPYKQLQIKYTNLQNQRQTVSKRVFELEKQMKQEIKNKEDKLEQAYRKIKTIFQSNNMLQQQLSSARLNFAQLETRYQSQVTEFRSKINLLENQQKLQNQSKRVQIEQINIEIQEKSKKLIQDMTQKKQEQIKNYKINMKAQIAQAQEIANKKSDEIRQLKFQISKLKSQITNKLNKQKEAQSYMIKLENQHRERQAQKDEVIKKLEVTIKTKDKLVEQQKKRSQQSIKQKQKQYIQLVNKLENFINSKQEAFETQKKTWTQNLNLLGSQKNMIDHQLKQTKIKFAKDFEQKEKLYLEKYSYQSQMIKTLQGNKKQAFQTLRKMENEKRAVEQQNLNMKREIRLKTEEIELKISQHKSIQISLTRSKEEYNNLSNEYTKLQQQYKNLQLNYRSLESSLMETKYEKDHVVGQYNSQQYEIQLKTMKIKKFQLQLEAYAQKSAQAIKLELQNKNLKHEIEQMFKTITNYEQKFRDYETNPSNQKKQSNFPMHQNHTFRKLENTTYRNQIYQNPIPNTEPISYVNKSYNYLQQNKQNRYQSFAARQNPRVLTDRNLNNLKNRQSRDKYENLKEQRPRTSTLSRNSDRQNHQSTGRLIQHQYQRTQTQFNDPFAHSDHSTSLLRAKLSQKNLNIAPIKSKPFSNKNQGAFNYSRGERQKLNQTILKRCQMIVNKF